MEQIGTEIESPGVGFDQSTVRLDHAGQFHLRPAAQLREESIGVIMAQTDDRNPHRRLAVLSSGKPRCREENSKERTAKRIHNEFGVRASHWMGNEFRSQES